MMMESFGEDYYLLLLLRGEKNEIKLSVSIVKQHLMLFHNAD